MSINRNNIPREYLCPITLDIMKEPMVMPDGHTYEKEAIKRALELRPYSPLTVQPMKFSDGYINYSLKSLIETYIKEHNINSTSINIDEKLRDLFSKQNKINEVEFEELSARYISEECNANLYKDGIYVTMKPKKITKTPPVFLICVVDVSGSMNINCCENISGVETLHLSRLDLIKHSLKTIISTLRKEDMISIIQFNTTASVIVKPTVLVGKAEKDRVISKMNIMDANTATNMWDGIKMGIDISNSISLKNYQKSIMVFTDGCSNIDPPKGLLQTLKDKLKTCSNDFTISTFSYGNDVNSKLLIDIANIGNGIYGYCSDGSMVGTTFINYMSNLLSTITPVVKVRVTQGNAIKKTMTIGPLYRGAYRNAIFRVDKNLLHQTKVIVELSMTHQQFKVPISLNSPNIQSYIDEMAKSEKKYNKSSTFHEEDDYYDDSDDDELLDTNSNSAMDLDDQDVSNDENCDANVLVEEKDYEPIKREEILLNQLMRTKLIVTLNKIIIKLNDVSTDEEYRQAKEILNEYIKTLRGLAYKTKFIKSLIVDINNPDPNHGQVEKAIQKKYFKTWGKNYIDSFLRFHQFEQCGNFKDQSLQYYANSVFTAYRKCAHNIFINLPPPEPQQYSSYPRFNFAVPSYNNHNNNRGIIFTNSSSPSSFSNTNSGCCFGFSSSSNNNNSVRFSFSNSSKSSSQYGKNSNQTSGSGFLFGSTHSQGFGNSTNRNNNNNVSTGFSFGKPTNRNNNNNTSTGFSFGNSTNRNNNNNNTSTQSFSFGNSTNRNNNNNNTSTQSFSFGNSTNRNNNNNNNNTSTGFSFGNSTNRNNNNNNTSNSFSFGNSTFGNNNNNASSKSFSFGNSTFGNNNNNTSTQSFGFTNTSINKSLSDTSSVMSSFLNRRGGCFNGDAMVLLANGQTKSVKDLKKGDRLKNNSIVQCLIEQNCSRSKSNNNLRKPYMCDIHGVLFTPYHPIFVNENWYFPIDLVQAKPVSVESWFNLILEDKLNQKYEVEFSNGIKAITLGHYRNENNILKHPYFGTDLVLKDLKERDPVGYSNGYIQIKEFNPKQLQYDSNNYCINYYKKSFSESENCNIKNTTHSQKLVC